MLKIWLISFILLVLSSLIGAHKNVLETELETCNLSPLTGFTRTGKCETNSQDEGTHLVCAKVTQEFLRYTKKKGNDLSTPRSWFPGLRPSDNWFV